MEQSIVFKDDLSESDFQGLSDQAQERVERQLRKYDSLRGTFSPIFHPAGFDMVQEQTYVGSEEVPYDHGELPIDSANPSLDIFSEASPPTGKSEKPETVENGESNTSESIIPTPPLALSQWVEFIWNLGKLLGFIAALFTSLNVFGIL